MAFRNILDGSTVGRDRDTARQWRLRISFAQKLVAHEGKHIEQHGVLEPAVGIHQALHAETEEVIVRDVGVAH